MIAAELEGSNVIKMSKHKSGYKRITEYMDVQTV